MKIKSFLDESLIFLIVKSADFIKDNLKDGLKESQLNFYQALILITLYTERKQELTPSHFTSVLKLSKATVSQSLTKLEELKCIKRTMNHDDARKTSIQLDSPGKEKAILLINQLQNIDANLENKLSTKELKELTHLLKKFLNII